MKNLLWSILILIGLANISDAQNVVYGYPYQYGFVAYQHFVNYYQPVVVQSVQPVVYYAPPVIVPVVTPVYYQPVIIEKHIPCWRRFGNYSPQPYWYMRY